MIFASNTGWFVGMVSGVYVMDHGMYTEVSAILDGDQKPMPNVWEFKDDLCSFITVCPD